MKVLLVGEGDFSFSAAIAKLSPEETAQAIGIPSVQLKDMDVTATSLDSFLEISSKYPEANSNIKVAAERGFDIRHEFDALSSSVSSENWDAVIWNHPHLGYEDAVAHKSLLSHFIHTCSTSQLIGIRLLAGQAERWELATAAERHGWFCSPGNLLNKIPGYHVKRNKTSKSFISEETRKNWQPDMEMQSLFYLLSKNKVEISSHLNPKESKPLHNCTSCPKSFSSPQGLRTHIRQVHELIKYNLEFVTCPNCSKQLSSQDALTQHLRACLQPEAVKRPRITRTGGSWKCVVCGASAENEESHFSIFSQSFETVDCEICGKSFRDSRALSQHRALH